jgi:hypothetical protein
MSFMHDYNTQTVERSNDLPNEWRNKGLLDRDISLQDLDKTYLTLPLDKLYVPLLGCCYCKQFWFTIIYWSTSLWMRAISITG